MVGIRILGTASMVPDHVVTTAQVVAEAMPDRDPAEVAARTGIDTRRWGGPEDSAVDWSTEVLDRALQQAGLPADALCTIIYTSSCGGDRTVPSTASAVGARVGAGPDCACFDVNNACTGFLTSLDLASHLARARQAPVAVVAVEVFHRFIAPDEPRSYVVFGDAAAAVVVGPGRTGGVLASDFGNDGRRLEATTCHRPEVSGRPARIEFGVPGRAITGYALDDMRLSIQRVHSESGLPADQVDWFFPHQPNGAMFDLFIEHFGGTARTWKVAHELGSLGAVSIPIALDRAWQDGGIRDGQHVLLAAVGAGSSRGAMLLRIER